MSQDIVVTVQKADIRSSLITPPTAQENLTYTGQEQALITAGSVTSGGTMQYSLTENGTYSQDIPTGTDAGTYTVWYRVIGDANHNDTAPASVAVSIGKKPLTITKVACADKIYDGTTTVATVQQPLMIDTGVNTAAGNEKLQITGLTAAFKDANVGTNKEVVIDASKAVITGAAASGGGATADPDNYQVNIPSSATATIKKAASSITINDAEWPERKHMAILIFH